MTKANDVIPDVRKENRSFFKKLFIAICIVFLVMGSLYIVYEELIETSPAINTIQIKDVFVDINGDGLVDYVSSANIVLNTGNNLNLPVSP